MRVILIFLLFLLFVGIAYASTQYTIDSCSFGVASDVPINSSNTGCETPGSSTIWTKYGGCGDMLINGAGDYVVTPAGTDCRNLSAAPVSPKGKKVTVQVDVTDSNSVAMNDADSFYVWCGSGCYNCNRYAFGSWDDINHNYTLTRGGEGANWFLLGTPTGAFADNETVTLKLVITPTSVTGYENGVERSTSTNVGNFEITECGIGCGWGQYGTDDCSAAIRWDNFSIKVERGDSSIIN